MANRPPPGFTEIQADVSPASTSGGRPPAGFAEQAAGVDTPRNLSFMDQARLVGKIANVVPEIAKSPVTRIQEGLDSGGEKLTEALGRRGHPTLGAIFGTEVQTLPAILGAASGLGAVETSEAPLAQAIRNTPRMLGPRYEAMNEAAGISKDLPVRRGSIPKFPGMDGLPSNVPPPEAAMVAPKSYPNETNSFLNFARARLDGLGDKLSPQELNDYKSMINTAIRERKILPGTDQYAIATKLVKDQVNPLLSKAVPGRPELDEIYKMSKTLRIAPELAKKIWQYVGPKMRWGAGVVGGQ